MKYWPSFISKEPDCNKDTLPSKGDIPILPSRDILPNHHNKVFCESRDNVYRNIRDDA